MKTQDTRVVFLLGYPGVGKRTVGQALAQVLDAVLVDNQLIHIPILSLFRWDGKFLLPRQTLAAAEPIRAAVLDAIENLAPISNSYVFTNVLEDTPEDRAQYAQIKALAGRRGSTFLAVMLTCEINEQVSRIDRPDRRERLKGSDPEGYRRYTQTTKLFTPPGRELMTVETTHAAPSEVARDIASRLGIEAAAGDGS